MENSSLEIHVFQNIFLPEPISLCNSPEMELKYVIG